MRPEEKRKRPVGKLLMILISIFFYLPILFVMLISFNSSKSPTVFKGFSMQWYEKLFESSSMMNAIWTTLIVAVIATFVATVFGTLAAIGLSKSRRIIKTLVTNINDFPIMNPDIVTAIGLMLLFITFGIERGHVTMILAHISFCTPYVMLSVMPKIRSLDPDLADAALDLGCTPWQAITKVIVPQIAPGIVAGALIAFTMSLDDFIISYFVTGRGVQNISILVYLNSKRITPTINALSTLIIVAITVILLIINIIPAIQKKTVHRDNPEV